MFPPENDRIHRKRWCLYITASTASSSKDIYLCWCERSTWSISFGMSRNSTPLPNKCCRRERSSTSDGLNLSRASNGFRWSGLKRAFERRTTSGPISNACSGRTVMECISFSRAWMVARETDGDSGLIWNSPRTCLCQVVPL